MSSKADPLYRLGAFIFIAATAGSLAGCDETTGTGMASNARARAPIPPQTLAQMAELGTTQNAPVLIRTYKKEAELEIWKMKPDGHYALLKTYPMCRWSGQLGPKVREGDRQVPEGFYSITPAQMNPNSNYYLSFNVGYPNAYDRALGHTGGSIMVHGICSSAGCFSMTDPQIGEIYAIAREGFAGGQRAIQMQSYPFRMTAENLAKYRLDQNIAFWKQLKQGADHFEVTHQEVAVGVCDRHYVFNATAADGSHFDPAGPCPALRQSGAASEVAAKTRQDEAKVAELAAQGLKPIRTVYVDGGQNPAFASRIGEVSRPEALAQAPVEIALEEGKGKKGKISPVVQMAALTAKAEPEAAAASTASDATATTAPAKSEGSVFGRIGGLFGQKSAEPQPPVVEPMVVTEPAVPQPADVPLPPRRYQAAAVTPAKPKVKLIAGATPTLPQGFSAVAQAEQH